MGVFGFAAAIPAAAMAAERGSKALILSPKFQAKMAQPFYGAVTEDAPATVARIATASKGRSMDEPLSDEEMARYNELKAKYGNGQ